MRRHLRPSCLASLVTIGFGLCAAASAGAQNLTRGRVTDEWHNPLEGVTVVAERPAAGLRQTTTTGEDGRFQFVGLVYDDWSVPILREEEVFDWSFSATLNGYEEVRQAVGLRRRGGNQQVNFRLPVVATGGRFGVSAEFEAEGGTPRFRFEADGTFEFEDAGGEGEGTYRLVALAAILIVRDYDGPNDTFNITNPVVVMFSDQLMTSLTHDGVQLRRLRRSFQRLRAEQPRDEVPLDELAALAEQGDTEAQINLGYRYSVGQGVPQDSAEAVRWYRLAADQGDASAQNDLGVRYMNGEGVSQDDGEAARWYRLAADQGHAAAQNNLGVLYGNGRGVPQDSAEAVRWYRLAADQGNAIAQYNLGVRYDNGEGVPLDYVEAVRWYRLAAEQGVTFAQIGLGSMYEFGEGVPQNYVEAHMWFSLAAAQASREDREDYVEARDAVAARMTADQIAEAQRRAREWTPTPGR